MHNSKMFKPTTERRLAAFTLVIRQVIGNFNNRSVRCMYRMKRCHCLHANNKAKSCGWEHCPLGEVGHGKT